MHRRYAIAHNFRVCRSSRSLTQSDVAIALGVSRGYVGDIERGVSPIPADLIPDMVRVLGLQDASPLFIDPGDRLL